MHTPDQREGERSAPEQTSVSVVDVESGVEFCGDLKNVSLAGLMFHAHMRPVVGADMALRFEYANRPMLHARMNVTRVEEQGTGYEIAGTLHKKG